MHNLTDDGDIDIKEWTELVERLLTEESQWHQIILPMLMILIFIVAFLGNLMTCVVIYYDKTMHTVTNYYLFNLAISDLLVTFSILTEILFDFGSDYRFFYYTFGDIICKIHFFLDVLLWNNGVLVMTALAVERYVAICYPLTLQSASEHKLCRVVKIMVVIWIVAIFEAIPELWTVRLIQTKKTFLCFIIPTRFARIYNAMLNIMTFLVPLGIMTFVYAMIAFQINVVQKKSSLKEGIFNHPNVRKVNKLIVILTLSFLGCWLPFFIIRIYIATWDTEKLLEWWTSWCRIAILNNWFSAFLNPVIFSLMSTKFRKSLKLLWTKKIRNNQQPEHLSRGMTVRLHTDRLV